MQAPLKPAGRTHLDRGDLSEGAGGAAPWLPAEAGLCQVPLAWWLALFLAELVPY